MCVQASTCAHNNRAIAPAVLPWRLQCYLVYGRRHHNTCPIFPQSPPHGIAPEQHRVDVAGWYLGWLFLQLLPLVSNKHLISLSLMVYCHCQCHPKTLPNSRDTLLYHSNKTDIVPPSGQNCSAPPNHAQKQAFMTTSNINVKKKTNVVDIERGRERERIERVL